MIKENICVGALLEVPAAVKLKKKVSFKEEVKVEFTDILDQEVNHNNKAHEIRGEQFIISLFRNESVHLAHAYIN